MHNWGSKENIQRHNHANISKKVRTQNQSILLHCLSLETVFLYRIYTIIEQTKVPQASQRNNKKKKYFWKNSPSKVNGIIKWSNQISVVSVIWKSRYKVIHKVQRKHICCDPIVINKQPSEPGPLKCIWVKALHANLIYVVNTLSYRNSRKFPLSILFWIRVDSK